jgi:hypothetical protein
MFIKQSQRGYGRNGEQFARGRFLAVFTHNKFKAEEQANPRVEGPAYWPAFFPTKPPHDCTCAGEAYYYQKSCPVHKSSYVIPEVDGRKLYGIVRHCSLRQFGHWMMGTINIAGQRATVSGTYGDDGLPMDYEDLTLAARAKLVELPKELCDKFWAGGGWNEAGSEAQAMHDWAAKTFKSQSK